MGNRNKVFFHSSGLGIGDMMRDLDNARIPFVIKSIADEGFAMEGINLKKASGVEHSIIFRMPHIGGPHGDHPDLTLTPKVSAATHWKNLKNALPTGISQNRSHVWLEPINEIDTHVHAEWLGEFCYEYSKFVIADGFNALFAGFNAGQPQPEHWKKYFSEFLNLCAGRPNRLGVSLHEGKIGDFTIPAWSPEYTPWLIGRYVFLNDACDNMKIARPTIYITEWAWSYNDLPSENIVKTDIDYLMREVSKVVNIRGVCLWNLDPTWQGGHLAAKMRKWVNYIKDISLKVIFPDPIPAPDLDPTPVIDKKPKEVKHVIHLLPQQTSLADLANIITRLYPTRTAFTFSHDVAHAVAYAGTRESVVVLWSPELWDMDIKGYFIDRGFSIDVQILPSRISVPSPSTHEDMKHYFFPKQGEYGPILILQNNWGEGSERTQLQVDGIVSYVTKNRQWEKRRIGSESINLLVDTSPGNDQYYTVSGPWIPRYWREGSTFNSRTKISFFYKKDCSPVSEPYLSDTILKLKKVHTDYSIGGFVFSRVAEIEWVVNGLVDETYWFATGHGLIRWRKYDGRESKVVSVIPSENQEPNIREVIGCL